MNEQGHRCGCCGHHGMDRRSFMTAAIAGGALAGAAFASISEAGENPASLSGGPRVALNTARQELLVQPVLTYRIPQRAKATSWRDWGGVMTEADVDAEMKRIDSELAQVSKKCEFPLRFFPLAKAATPAEGKAIAATQADVMLIYGAGGGGEILESLISPDRYNLLFLRHRSGPVYLWYEIASPRLLRKTVDELGQPGLEPADVMVDEPADLAWRLRSLSALKNTLGSKILVVGGASGWGMGGQKAPQITNEKWKIQFVDVSYDDLGKRIQSARNDAARVQACDERARQYLSQRGTSLKTDQGFVDRAFLLTSVFEDLMAEAGVSAMTINNCMGTIMPMSETTACLPLSVINDSGAMAFCESDFVVIPSGILLHNICGTPVFLNDPTYPHHGMVTVAHCTAPRMMDGKRLEKAGLYTHFESDYGAAPKVDMRLGQTITMIDPDFNAVRWIGFRGKILANPFHDICRSQIDVSIEGDCDKLAREMVGFHWMLAYGDHLKEVGYALRKIGIDWVNLSDGSPETV